MSGHSRKTILAEQAHQDVLEILELSLELWGPRQKDAYAAAIDRALVRLAQFPEIGESLHQVMPGMRRFRVEHHLIHYTYDDREVIVHRILHERRQVSSRLFLPEPDT